MNDVKASKADNGARMLSKTPDVRMHDVRHSHASVAAGIGESLPIIGKLLVAIPRHEQPPAIRTRPLILSKMRQSGSPIS